MDWAKVAFQNQDLLTLLLYLSSMARRGSRASKPSGKWLDMGQCSPPRDLLSELLPPDYCPQFDNGRSRSMCILRRPPALEWVSREHVAMRWTLILSLLARWERRKFALLGG